MANNKTIIELHQQNLMTENKIFKFVEENFQEAILRIENISSSPTIYIYGIGSGIKSYNIHRLLIIDCNNYKITCNNEYSSKNFKADLKKYKFYSIKGLKFNDIYIQYYLFTQEINKYLTKLLNDKKSEIIRFPIFSALEKKIEYNREKLIINDVTKNLTIDEYKDYIESINQHNLDIWNRRNQRNFDKIDKFAIIGQTNRFIYNNQKDAPLYFGKTIIDKYKGKFKLKSTTHFYGGGLFEYSDKEYDTINTSFRIIYDDEIDYLKNMWKNFLKKLDKLSLTDITIL